MDEATPHLHIDFIPYITGSKRGLATRVSLKKALETQGFKGEGKSGNERNLWIESEKEALAEVMKRHGIGWEKKGTHREHLDVLNFKKEQRGKEIAELENRIEALTPDVKKMERLAEEFSQDPEKILPEAVPLESAKSYRERKAKPLFDRMAKMILSIYAAFVKLRNDYRELERKYATEKTKVSVLERLLTDKQKQRYKMKNRVPGERNH